MLIDIELSCSNIRSLIEERQYRQRFKDVSETLNQAEKEFERVSII